MPQMSKVAEKNFEQMLALVHQARAKNRKLLFEAVRAGDAEARKAHAKIESDLTKEHHRLVDLQADYVASNTDRSEAEKALKSLVSNTRKRVRRVRTLADAMQTVADVAEKIAAFAAVL